VFEWFKKRRDAIAAPRVTPRKDVEVTAEKVNLADMSPDAVSLVAQVAYFELAVFESLSRAVSEAPDLAAKEGLSTVAGEALEKHHGLVAILRSLKADPAQAMAPFADDIDRFESLTRGRDWYETLVGVYLTAGFLNEFFLALAVSLPPKHRKVVKELLESDRTADVLVRAIRAGEEADPKLASRLALWGRRLMGDTQLVARSALRLSDNANDNESKLEPVFTDLVGSHSKRMDALGLTA
jgi:hypothetical protein